jgi:hypothetical protein
MAANNDFMKDRYDLRRFKAISVALSPENRAKTNKEIEDFRAALGKLTASKNKGEALPEAEFHLLWNCKTQLERTMSYLDNVAKLGVTGSPSREYSFDPRKWLQNCTNAVQAFKEFIIITGDKSLDRELKKIEKELAELKKELAESESKPGYLDKARAVGLGLINLIPNMFRAARAFIGDAMVNLKASHYQLKGYEGFVSKASKKIWGDIRPDDRGISPAQLVKQQKNLQHAPIAPIDETVRRIDWKEEFIKEKYLEKNDLAAPSEPKPRKKKGYGKFNEAP